MSKDTWALKFFDGSRSFELLVRYPTWGFESEAEDLGRHLAERLNLEFMSASRDEGTRTDES